MQTCTCFMNLKDREAHNEEALTAKESSAVAVITVAETQ